MDVAVIGAGIVGINSALAISKDGARVVVVDRLDPGEGCSFGNAGLFSPWSFVPIFGPEVLPSVPRYLLDPLAPLTIRWTRLPQILPWLLRMVFKANAAHLRHAAEAMHHLTIGCGEAYAELAREAGTPELVRQETMLQVYSSEQDFKKADKDFAYRARFGIRYESLDRKGLHDLEPAVGEMFQWGHAL
nr:FAD-dependent oxidoreductase [Desulfuromonadales bacterium]